jgi:hypothetical protein
MAIDPAISSALKMAAKEVGQGEAVANRLLAWITQMSENDVAREAHAKFCDEARQALGIKEVQDAD